MRFIAALVLAALCSFTTDCAVARPGRGGVATGGGTVTCPQGSSFADGCATAPLNALSQNSSFFTYARQSGQVSYATRPPWNVAGVDYPIGAYTADNALLDPVTNTPAGCTYDSSNLWIRCNGSATIVGYRFNGVAIFMPTTASTLYLEDNHFTVTGANCDKYAGLQLVTGSNNGTTTALSNTIDFAPECQINADLYGQPGDPGLVQQSSFTGTFSAGVLQNGNVKLGTGTTGTMRATQFINYSGQSGNPFSLVNNIHFRGTASAASSQLTIQSVDPNSPNATPQIGDLVRCASGCGTVGVTVTSLASPGVYNLSGAITLGSGTTVETVVTSCVASACNNSLWNTTLSVTAGPVAASTGPSRSAAASWLGAGNSSTVKYNYNVGYADLFNTGTTLSQDVRFNYSEFHGQNLQHVNFMQIQPNVAGTIASLVQNFNTVLWTSNSYNSGTTTIGQFTTGPSNNSPIAPHGEVITTLSQMNNNTIIGNVSAIPGQSSTTAAALRYLTQGSAAVAASFTASFSSTTMTVTAFSAGTGALLPGTIVICTGCNVVGVQPMRIVSQLTGPTGDVGDYQMDRAITLTSRAVTTWLPGEITTLEQKDNYIDNTGMLSTFTDDINAIVTNLVRTGNINIRSGNACNSNGSCP